MASRSLARGRQTTLRLQKQVFVHTQLSRAYLALAIGFLVQCCCVYLLFTADDAGKPLKVAGDYQPSHCWNFTSRSGSFTSPFYPLNYPNKTECVQTLVGQSSHFCFANTRGCKTVGNGPLSYMYERSVLRNILKYYSML